MKKIEFVRVKKINGEVYYYTTINGKMVDGSVSLKAERAMRYHEDILKGKETVVDILSHIDV